MQTQEPDLQQNAKDVIVKQNNMIAEQSTQMLSMVDIINTYTQETKEMQAKLDSCSSLNTEIQKKLSQSKSIFEIQMLSVLLLLLLIFWYFR